MGQPEGHTYNQGDRQDKRTVPVFSEGVDYCFAGRKSTQTDGSLSCDFFVASGFISSLPRYNSFTSNRSSFHAQLSDPPSFDSCNVVLFWLLPIQGSTPFLGQP